MPRVHLPPFPYTTLFRSGPIDRCAVHTDVAVADQLPGRWNRRCEAQPEYDAVQPSLQQRKKQRARRTGLAAGLVKCSLELPLGNPVVKTQLLLLLQPPAVTADPSARCSPVCARRVVLRANVLARQPGERCAQPAYYLQSWSLHLAPW